MDAQVAAGGQQTVEILSGQPQAYNFTLTDAAGCSYSVANTFVCGSLCNSATQVVAGTVATLAPVCAGNSFTATTTGTALFDGDVLGYVLHANAFDNVLDPATHLDFNASGNFTNPNVGSSFYTVYVTPIAADENGAGLPDLTDNCLSVGAAVPVVFLAPLNLIINEDCDFSTGIYYLTISPIGGLPQLDGSSYTIVGTNINGQFNMGGQQQIEIPEGEAQFYDFALTDGTGCVYTTSSDFVCIKTPIELLSYTGKALPRATC